MQRYFVEESFNDQKQMTITGEAARHISKVMRMRKGEKIIVVQNGIAYVCTILSIGQDVKVEQTGKRCHHRKCPFRWISLAVCRKGINSSSLRKKEPNSACMHCSLCSGAFHREMG